MDGPFTTMQNGYEIRADGQLLEDGLYAPTLLICRDRGDTREEHSIPIPGPEAFQTFARAREHAFEHGMHWVKENS